MKTIVISDLHLTDKFDRRKCDILLEIFSDCDRVILNGDFWSYYSITFDDFLKSKWNVLFPVLLKKKTVYLFGNHDESKWCDDRVETFSDKQGYEYVLKQEPTLFNIQHGHKLLPHKFIQNEKYVKVIRTMRFDEKMRHPFEKAGDKYFNTSQKFGKRLNKQIKTQSKKRFDDNSYIVVGHTHVQEISKKDRFISTGYVEFGVAQYLEINDNSFELKERYY